MNTKYEIEAERREYQKSVKLLKKKGRMCIWWSNGYFTKRSKEKNNKVLEYYLHLRRIYIHTIMKEILQLKKCYRQQYKWIRQHLIIHQKITGQDSI